MRIMICQKDKVVRVQIGEVEERIPFPEFYRIINEALMKLAKSHRV